MKKIEHSQAFRKKMDWTSNTCEKHTCFQNGEEVVIPMKKMIINGKEVCPKCEVEEANKKLTAEIQKWYDSKRTKMKFNVLAKQSILANKTLLKAEFSNYIPEIEEERANKLMCLEITERLMKGEVFNVLIQGKQGVGKSHLAYSILRELNDANQNTSSLFVSVDEMMRHIRDSYSNKESKYTESYFMELLSSVDYLVLDDLGAETGAIETNKAASDFVQRVLYSVSNARQDKVTISTTNLDGQRMSSMYDKKLISRLLNNRKTVIFKESKDKRLSRLPF